MIQFSIHTICCNSLVCSANCLCLVRLRGLSELQPFHRPHRGGGIGHKGWRGKAEPSTVRDNQLGLSDLALKVLNEQGIRSKCFRHSSIKLNTSMSRSGWILFKQLEKEFEGKLISGLGWGSSSTIFPKQDSWHSERCSGDSREQPSVMHVADRRWRFRLLFHPSSSWSTLAG